MLIYSYQKLIDKLILRNNNPEGNDSVFFSLYLNTKGFNRSDLQTIINSAVKDAFTGNKDMKQSKNLRDRLYQRIMAEIRNLDTIGNGMAVFAELLTEEHEITELYIINLPQNPRREVFLGEVYDLDQLIWINKISVNHLIINIQHDIVQIFSRRESELKQLAEFNNNLFKEAPPEYFERFRPYKSGEGIHHGTGSINLQRHERTALKKFFNDAIKETKRQIERINFKYIVLFYSPVYEFLKDFMINDLETRFGVGVLVESTIISKSDRQRLSNLSQSIIKDFERKQQREVFKFSRENPDQMARGWKEVCDASRLEKIDILFIRPHTQKEGYIQRDDLLYTYPVKNSRKLDNIGPRLVKNTLDKGGEIFVIREQADSRFNGEVAAKLRY